MSPLLRVSPSRHLLLLAILLLPLPAYAFLGFFTEEKFPFEVVIADSKNLAEKVEESVRAQRDQSNEFDDFKQPQAAARFDRDVIKRWLRSQGFFDAAIDTRFTEESIVYTVMPGQQYIIEKLTLELPEGVEPPPREALPAQEGEPLKAQAVLDTTRTLQNHIVENYCLFEVEADYDAEINRATAAAFVTFTVKPSAAVVFGEPEIRGPSTIDLDYLHQYLTFEAGDCFRRRQVELSRLALLQTNLLSRVEVQVEQPQDSKVKVIFDATERNHRTIKAGIGYDTNTRTGLSLGWENRNLSNRGERLSIDGHFSEILKDVAGEITAPHFKRENQTLTLRANVKQERASGYETDTGLIGGELQRPLHKHVTGSLGSYYEYSQQLDLSGVSTEQPDSSDEEAEEDITRRENFSLLSFPLRLDYINNNNPLNPTRGWSLGLVSEPFFSLENTGDRFVKSTLAASTYLTAREVKTTPTLALRAATGIINGAVRREVPASHQFYVGGGGSVRGYAYQTVGELSEGRQRPMGGLSFSEVSIELRFRFNENWGAVLFSDGGYAYLDRAPSFGGDFLWGAGVGVRYFTSFAPIRFDIAAPLTRRPERREGKDNPYFDDALQLYISLGQSF